MKRCLFWVFAGILAVTTSLAGSMRYYALEVRGGSRVFSLDPPVRKGHVLLFHRYPDGTYMSVAAAEIEKVVELAAEPGPRADELAPGGTVYVGPALPGPGFRAPRSEAPDAAVSYPDYGYDYGYGYWGGGFVPPRPPPPAPPSRIGPNGFPIIAPPGTPGSVPPPIGPNGFPILAPPPFVPSPRGP